MASFGDRFVGAMTLDVRTFEEIEQDPTAMGQAVTVVVISAVAAGIGNLFHGGTSIVVGVVGGLIGYAAWAGLVFVIGTKVMPEPQTKADFAEVFRVVGFAAAPGVFKILGIIPFLGWLIAFAVSIWMLVAMVVAVRQVLDYTDTVKAVIVCVIGFVAYLIVTLFVLAPLAFLSRF
jgi:Yip1-like protein